MIVTAKLPRDNRMCGYCAIISTYDRPSLFDEITITPKAKLDIRVTVTELLKNCDDWSDVSARPPADCQNLHVVPPLFVMDEQYIVMPGKPDLELQ